jgi:hypothetical protein
MSEQPDRDEELPPDRAFARRLAAYLSGAASEQELDEAEGQAEAMVCRLEAMLAQTEDPAERRRCEEVLTQLRLAVAFRAYCFALVEDEPDRELARRLAVRLAAYPVEREPHPTERAESEAIRRIEELRNETTDPAHRRRCEEALDKLRLFHAFRDLIGVLARRARAAERERDELQRRLDELTSGG